MTSGTSYVSPAARLPRTGLSSQATSSGSRNRICRWFHRYSRINAFEIARSLSGPSRAKLRRQKIHHLASGEYVPAAILHRHLLPREESERRYADWSTTQRPLFLAPLTFSTSGLVARVLTHKLRPLNDAPIEST